MFRLPLTGALLCAGTLASSCIVYTPDLLDESNKAVSLGEQTTPTAAPGATLRPPTALPGASAAGPLTYQTGQRVGLQRSRLAPDLLGGPTGESSSSDELEVDSGCKQDAGAADSGLL